MGTRTERGPPKASDLDDVLGGAPSFGPKLDLHYRNSSDAGIFESAVVSPFHVTREGLTDGILS